MNRPFLDFVPMVVLWSLFFVLLVVAVVSDLRERRVSNKVSGSLLLLGLLASILQGGIAVGLPQSLGGVAIGMAIWFPMYLLRLVGAGDVKLFAAGSAWIGWQGALVGSLATGLLGGVLGLLWLLHRQGLQAGILAIAQSLRAPKLLQLTPLDRRERVPYALAIAGGLSCGWWWAVLPWLHRYITRG